MKFLPIVFYLALTVPAALGQNYECIAEGNSFMAGYPVDVSYECCVGSQALFDKNNGILETKYDACAASLEDELYSNLYSFCNAGMTKCVFDYEDFDCVGEVVDMCQAMGGNSLEGDLVVECKAYGEKVTFEFKNRETCVASACTEEDFGKVLEGLMAAMSDQQDVDCHLKKVEGSKVNGVPTEWSSASHWSMAAPAAALMLLFGLVW